jgi:hypothetical protein
MKLQDTLKKIENKIKCIIYGHIKQYGYNIEKGLQITRCARCYKIIEKHKDYTKKK